MCKTTKNIYNNEEKKLCSENNTLLEFCDLVIGNGNRMFSFGMK